MSSSVITRISTRALSHESTERPTQAAPRDAVELTASVGRDVTG